MRTDFPLVARLFVNVRTTENREFLNFVGQRDRPAHLCAGPFGRVNDFLGAGVQHAVIEGLQPDADGLTLHFGSFGT